MPQSSPFWKTFWPFLKCILIVCVLFWSLGLYFYIKSLPNARRVEEKEENESRESTHAQFGRLKRDFMFAPGHNETSDSDCFQVCFWESLGFLMLFKNYHYRNATMNGNTNLSVNSTWIALTSTTFLFILSYWTRKDTRNIVL
jgi:hypothetical protein